MPPPSSPAQVDLRDCLVGRSRQASQGGSQSPSEAVSKGTRPKDQGGAGRQGGSQASKPHERMIQAHLPSPRDGPPRHALTSNIMSGTLTANSSGHGSRGPSGPSGHSKWQPEERDKSVDKKVNTFTVGLLRIYHLSSGLDSLYKIYNKIFYIFLFQREVCFNNITFQQLFLNVLNFCKNILYKTSYYFFHYIMI